MAWYHYILKFSKVSTMFSVSFIAKHYFVFLFILSLLPNIISAVQIAQETQNPAYPFFAVGLSITNADAQIGEDVRILEEDPKILLGEKPEFGLWKNSKYYFGYFLLFWKFAGNLILILTPFLIIHKAYKVLGKDGVQSSESNTLTKTLITGLIFIFFINLILLIYNLSQGNVTINSAEGDLPKQLFYIIMQTFPLHGVFSLIMFLATLK